MLLGDSGLRQSIVLFSLFNFFATDFMNYLITTPVSCFKDKVLCISGVLSVLFSYSDVLDRFVDFTWRKPWHSKKMKS